MTECMQIPKYRQIHRQVATFTLCVGPMNSNTITNYFFTKDSIKIAYKNVCKLAEKHI